MSSCKIENEFFAKPKTHLREKEKKKEIEIFFYILAEAIGQDLKPENVLRKQAVRLALPRNGTHDLFLKKIILEGN